MKECDHKPQNSPQAASLRKRLYEMKNGIVADSLRAGGCPYKMIWGLNLPQLVEIASEVPQSAELAEEMWNDSVLREAHLLGPLLYPRESMDKSTAIRWLDGIKWIEDADILCFKLLKFLPFASEIAASLSESELPLQRYTALRLYFNIVSKYPEEAKAAAGKELSRPQPAATLARMLLEEARFILGEE